MSCLISCSISVVVFLTSIESDMKYLLVDCDYFPFDRDLGVNESGRMSTNDSLALISDSFQRQIPWKRSMMAWWQSPARNRCETYSNCVRKFFCRSRRRRKLKVCVTLRTETKLITHGEVKSMARRLFMSLFLSRKWISVKLLTP